MSPSALESLQNEHDTSHDREHHGRYVADESVGLSGSQQVLIAETIICSSFSVDDHLDQNEDGWIMKAMVFMQSF